MHIHHLIYSSALCMLLSPFISAGSIDTWEQEISRTNPYRGKNYAPKVTAQPKKTTPFVDEKNYLTYKQTKYQRIDPKGDEALAWLCKELQAKFKDKLQKKWTRQFPRTARFNEENPIGAAVKPDTLSQRAIADMPISDVQKEKLKVEQLRKVVQIEGHKKPFTAQTLSNMLFQIISEEAAAGIKPTLGTPHRWSDDYQNILKRNTPLPKMTMCLTIGVSSRFLYTEKELPLINYLKSRPDASVTLDEMFRTSYRLNKGDVYLTLLTVLNVLSDAWLEESRANTLINGKLSNISNFYQGRGDKFGAWYHLFGIMLFSYVNGVPTAAAVAEIESMGSHFLQMKSDSPDERQEDYSNSTGAQVGGRLRTFVKKELYATFEQNPDYANPQKYLSLNEDYRHRAPIVNSKEMKVSVYQGDVELMVSDKAKCANCILEIFPFKNGDYMEKKKYVKVRLKLEPWQKYTFPADVKNMTSIRVILTNLETRTIETRDYKF